MCLSPKYFSIFCLLWLLRFINEFLDPIRRRTTVSTNLETILESNIWCAKCLVLNFLVSMNKVHSVSAPKICVIFSQKELFMLGRNFLGKFIRIVLHWGNNDYIMPCGGEFHSAFSNDLTNANMKIFPIYTWG